MLQEFLHKFGYLALFAGTFFEGETIVVLAGFLAFREYFDIKLVILISFCGSFAGDQLWYYLGRTKGRKIIASRPKMQAMCNKALHYLGKNPDLWVLTFRFVYGIRTVMPVAIGLHGYPPLRYFILNGIGAIVWAITLSLASYYFGTVLIVILGNIKKYEFWILGALVGAGLILWLWRSYKASVELKKIKRSKIMTNQVAILLSGCGVYDGTEIHECVLTMLFLEQKGVNYQCFAPNINQHHVINHLTGQETSETRNVLVESARIARGNIIDIANVDIAKFDALFIPGGFGAAKNLSNFAFKGEHCTVNPSVLAFVQQFANLGKPVGMCCIAPHLAAKVYAQDVKCTIGNDVDTANKINVMGAQHVTCAVDDVIIDTKHKLVTTPAYMLGNSIATIAQGINKMVDEVLNMVKN